MTLEEIDKQIEQMEEHIHNYDLSHNHMEHSEREYFDSLYAELDELRKKRDIIESSINKEPRS